jgi:alpha-tubulin suppressor-like RCC1 family protein
VTVTPDSVRLSPGDTVRLTATARFATGAVVHDWPASWTSGDTLVATVTAEGLVRAVGQKLGPVAIRASVDDANAAATIEVGGIAFVALDVGDAHSCALTAAGAAYCWGYNGYGQLGIGATRPFSFAVPITAFQNLRFRQLSAGVSVTCGLPREDGAAVCAGANAGGQLGIGGASPAESLPQLVTGGLTFTSVWTGDGGHTCGLAAGGAAYCWGANTSGQLGNGNAYTQVAPTAVIGGHTFRQLALGGEHTCALATDSTAYCWGNDLHGQLGSYTNYKFSTPIAVDGGIKFLSITAGTYHTCALDQTGRAYCLGDNEWGELGIGTFDSVPHYIPQPVASNLAFVQLSAGEMATCGLTGTGEAYCWGRNEFGELGDGSTTNRPAPVPVAGGLTFTQISRGVHTCGLAASGAVYCWGENFYGEVGDGTDAFVGPDAPRLTPMHVLGTGAWKGASPLNRTYPALLPFNRPVRRAGQRG